MVTGDCACDGGCTPLNIRRQLSQHILRWSSGIDGLMFDVPTTTLFISSLPFASDLNALSGCLDRSVRFPNPPFLVSTIFLTTLFVRCLSLETLGVMPCAFPSAIAAAQPLSLSNLQPTAIYGWAVSVGTEAAQCNAKLPCDLCFQDHFQHSVQCALRLARISIETLATAISSHTSNPQHRRCLDNITIVLGSKFIDSFVPLQVATTLDQKLMTIQPPDGSDDNECLSVQLDSSDMAPNAAKTVLRQRFPMRCYYLEHNGWLLNSAKVMDGNTLNTDTTCDELLTRSSQLVHPVISDGDARDDEDGIEGVEGKLGFILEDNSESTNWRRLSKRNQVTSELSSGFYKGKTSGQSEELSELWLGLYTWEHGAAQWNVLEGSKYISQWE
ncbi:hypothetical protein EDB83DRAFT_2320330 [Lactarius deliciosus]|nr:hypothetical protein EDB83DRAFT_2320330 [Lactarius deliciosus]